MTPNPYAPPDAEVADVTSLRPPTPRAVGNACRLIIASLVLGIVSLLPGIRVPRPDDPQVPLAFTLGSVVVFGGLTLWLALEVWRGKRWARWVMLAYLVLGWWLGAGDMSDDFLRSPLLGTLDAVCILLEAIACALLFFGAGARWFAALAALRREPASGG
jgi:hypothetical protein